MDDRDAMQTGDSGGHGFLVEIAALRALEGRLRREAPCLTPVDRAVLAWRFLSFLHLREMHPDGRPYDLGVQVLADFRALGGTWRALPELFGAIMPYPLRRRLTCEPIEVVQPEIWTWWVRTWMRATDRTLHAVRRETIRVLAYRLADASVLRATGMIPREDEAMRALAWAVRKVAGEAGLNADEQDLTPPALLGLLALLGGRGFLSLLSVRRPGVGVLAASIRDRLREPDAREYLAIPPGVIAMRRIGAGEQARATARGFARRRYRTITAVTLPERVASKAGDAVQALEAAEAARCVTAMRSSFARHLGDARPGTARWQVLVHGNALAAGLSLRELGRRAGISATALSRARADIYKRVGTELRSRGAAIGGT